MDQHSHIVFAHMSHEPEISCASDGRSRWVRGRNPTCSVLCELGTVCKCVCADEKRASKKKPCGLSTLLGKPTARGAWLLKTRCAVRCHDAYASTHACAASCRSAASRRWPMPKLQSVCLLKHMVSAGPRITWQWPHAISDAGPTMAVRPTTPAAPAPAPQRNEPRHHKHEQNQQQEQEQQRCIKKCVPPAFLFRS